MSNWNLEQPRRNGPPWTYFFILGFLLWVAMLTITLLVAYPQCPAPPLPAPVRHHLIDWPRPAECDHGSRQLDRPITQYRLEQGRQYGTLWARQTNCHTVSPTRRVLINVPGLTAATGLLVGAAALEVLRGRR